MIHNKFLSIIFITVFMAGQSVSAQIVSGFQGKRFLAKTCLLSPIIERGINIELEYCAFRGANFGIQARYNNRPFTNIKDGINMNVFSGNTTAKLLVFTFRRFLTSGVPPPNGFYTRLTLGGGGVSASYVNSYWTSNTNVTFSNYKNNLAVVSEAGIGLQHVYFNRMVLDIGCGFSLNFVFLNEELRNKLPLFVQYAYRSNVGPLNYEYPFGFYANIQLGVLLF